MKTLIRRRVLRRLIWVCTICLCPKNGTLGLYGLIIVMTVKQRGAAQQIQQYDLCTQRRLRSTLASAQSDQSLWKTLGLWLFPEHTAKTVQTERMRKLIWSISRCTGHFCLVLSWRCSKAFYPFSSLFKRRGRDRLMDRQVANVIFQ